MPEFVSRDGSDLISKVLNTDPNKRYTEDNIRKHKWFKLFQPECNNEGLIIGKNTIPVEPMILELIE